MRISGLTSLTIDHRLNSLKRWLLFGQVMLAGIVSVLLAVSNSVSTSTSFLMHWSSLFCLELDGERPIFDSDRVPSGYASPTGGAHQVDHTRSPPPMAAYKDPFDEIRAQIYQTGRWILSQAPNPRHVTLCAYHKKPNFRNHPPACCGGSTRGNDIADTVFFPPLLCSLAAIILLLFVSSLVVILIIIIVACSHWYLETAFFLTHIHMYKFVDWCRHGPESSCFQALVPFLILTLTLLPSRFPARSSYILHMLCSYPIPLLVV
jgi:hypothetical protein